MKKIAILFNNNMRDNAGGPAGYLYNLYEGLSNELLPDFIFPGMFEIEDVKHTNKPKKSKEASGMRSFLYFFKQGILLRKKLKFKIDEYDVVHAHMSELVVYLKLFCGYKGKIVFTPHRPESLRDELISNLKLSKNGNYVCLGFFYDLIERLSYKIADAYIFPSEGAKNIYDKFPGFSKYSQHKPCSYVFTGVKARKVTIDRKSYRLKYGISNEAFVIGYAGRHNAIKGYDRLKNLLNKLPDDVEYLIAGSNDNVDFPQNERWHELGYVNDVFNLINASDVIVIPNRDTYFDLAIIEAFAYGRIVVSSNTGGNLDIHQLNNGMILFDNNDDNDLIRVVNSIISLKKEKRDELETCSKKFYDGYCNENRFARYYTEALKEVTKSFDEKK